MNKQEWIQQVEKYDQLANDIRMQLWENPEVAGEEKFASALYRKVLVENGFTITEVPDMPYAFVAEYGQGSPVIAVLGEYDALPNSSQKVSAVKEEVNAGGNGHGCGHNILGAAALAGTLAAKDMIEANKLTGTIRFYGCPEEETLIGKVKMIKAGMFDGCDVALSWHPMSTNQVYENSYLANNSIKFKFYGVASHAGFAPHLGRSALDAVELMNVGANYLREHIIDQARVHYTTNSAGFPPNIVHPYADVWYYVRAPHRSDVNEITERLTDVAKGAALMAGVTMEVEKISGTHEAKGVPTMTDLAYKNLVEVGAPKFNTEEMAFAEELQGTLTDFQITNDLKLIGKRREDNPVLHQEVCSMEINRTCTINASSDSGDVSMIMPMALFTTACWPVGAPAHSWQATASTGHSIAHTGAMTAAKVISGMIHDMLEDPSMVVKMKEEHAATHDTYVNPLD
ncbi:amidohydrolase [Anaerotignum sp.]